MAEVYNTEEVDARMSPTMLTFLIFAGLFLLAPRLLMPLAEIIWLRVLYPPLPVLNQWNVETPSTTQVSDRRQDQAH